MIAQGETTMMRESDVHGEQKERKRHCNAGNGFIVQSAAGQTRRCHSSSDIRSKEIRTSVLGGDSEKFYKIHHDRVFPTK